MVDLLVEVQANTGNVTSYESVLVSYKVTESDDRFSVVIVEDLEVEIEEIEEEPVLIEEEQEEEDVVEIDLSVGE